MLEHGVEQCGITQTLIGQAELGIKRALFAQQLTRLVGSMPASRMRASAFLDVPQAGL